MIGRPEIVAIINTCFDAVNASKVGPIYNADDQKTYNTIAYNTFLYAVQKMLPQAMDLNMSGDCTSTEVSADGTIVKKVQTMEAKGA